MTMDELLKQLLLDLGYSVSDVEGFLRNPILNKIDKEQLYVNIPNLFSYLADLKFSNDEIIKITIKYPQLFALEPESLNSKRAYMLDILKYTKENLNEMIKRFPLLLILTQEHITRRVDDMIKLGYTQEQVKIITVENPQLYGLNMDYIREKNDFYRSIGLEGIFVNSSESIEWSIEFVYARVMFLKSMGINIDIDTLFKKESNFVEKYGKSSKQLMEEYPYARGSFRKRN